MTILNIKKFLSIMHMIKFVAYRRKKLAQFYGTIIKDGDVVYDVGANKGLYTSIFLERGAKVLAVEPNLSLAYKLHRKFKSKNNLLGVLPLAVAETSVIQKLYQCGNSLLSTISSEWIDTINASSRFNNIKFDRYEFIGSCTLKGIISGTGFQPTYIKIDTEGIDIDLLSTIADLNIPIISFEFSSESIGKLEKIILSYYQNRKFNITIGNDFSFYYDLNIDAKDFLCFLKNRITDDKLFWGDVFVFN